jgi:ADP-heptose:LPS heptosyltransferase
MLLAKSKTYYDVLFLVDSGIGNIIESLYAVEYCINNSLTVGILSKYIEPSFKTYLKQCYGDTVVLDTAENIYVKHLIHSFSFQDYIDINFENYFYVQPDLFSSKYLTETVQYLSIVRALYPSHFNAYTLKFLSGSSTERVKSLNIADKIVLYPGCSSFRSVSRWPHYLELMEKMGKQNVIFIGGNDDVNFESSYIYPNYIAGVFPQNILNKKWFWNLLKKTNLLTPWAHFKNLEKNDNSYFNFFSWTEFVEIFSRCKLFIGNDGGLMHLAAASGAKGIAIFGASSAKKSGPYNPMMKRLHTDYECQPCFFGVGKVKMSIYYINCPYGVRCLRDISVDMVLELSESILKSEARQHG